jgi:predicted RNA-binding Zn-ribbon protein involved in translation (DUF1610 family)
MVRYKDKMFGCPACGFRVSSSEDACPRCGNAFNVETRFECPFCGELVERGAKTCQACHVNYAEFKEKTEARGGDDSIDALLVEIIKLESTAVKQDDKKFSCPKCAWMLDGSEEKCPKCGEDFKDVSFQCPICGSSVSSDSYSCPECGVSFSEDTESKSAQHESAETSLDEIATAASRTHSLSEELEAPEAREAERSGGKEDVSAVTDKISSIFGKIADAVKVESKPQQPSSPPSWEKPVEDVTEEPEPMKPAPAPEPQVEEEPKEVQAEPEPPAATGPPKKTKTRKLKAKPQGAKPK